jgi:hypothetical protein
MGADGRRVPAENKELGIDGQPVVDQCDGILIACHKTADAPRWLDPSEKACGIARLQTHIEAIERDLQAAPDRFDVSLFSGPAQEKPFDSLLSWKPSQRLYLSGGKMMVRNVLVSDIRTDSLDVHPDISIPAEGENRKILRMRQVETQCSLGCPRHERRLSLSSKQKLQIFRPLSQISPQKRPQRPTRRYEAISIAIELKARCSFVLVFAQMRMQQRLRGSIDDQMTLPYVNLIGP